MQKGTFNRMMYLFLLFVVPFVNCDRVVYTNNGPIKGISLTEKKVEAFLGIPYAEPPVGPLRFAKPVPKLPWKETYHAKELPSYCIQATMQEFASLLDSRSEMKEDCLYLNMWVPEGGSELKPIMVFIHGGGYMVGSSNQKIYTGAALSERGDVIVASMNYRLGTLGFFSSATAEAAGNFGMLDQIMAIQWIKDNAKHFKGDPDNIVLFGESAGAFSTSLHTISPLSQNLFKRAILLSGTVFHPMYSDGNEILLKHSQNIASQLNCDDTNEALKNNPKGVVDCMMKLPSSKFSEIDTIFQNEGGMLIPRVGDDFLPVNPIDLFRKGEFKNTELLLGVTRDEGPLLLAFMKRQIFSLTQRDPIALNESFAKEIIQSLTQVDGDSEIVQSYFDRVKKESRYTYLNAISDMEGDYLITCGAVFQADYQSLKNQPVYFYLFDYRSASLPFPEWMGVPHFGEMEYVFGNPLYKPFTQYEEEFSKDIMDMFIAFAKTGNPNIPGNMKWPRYTYEDPKYFIISQKDRVGVRPDNYRCEAWRKLFRSEVDDEVIKNLRRNVD